MERKTIIDSNGQICVREWEGGKYKWISTNTGKVDWYLGENFFPSGSSIKGFNSSRNCRFRVNLNESSVTIFKKTKYSVGLLEFLCSIFSRGTQRCEMTLENTNYYKFVARFNGIKNFFVSTDLVINDYGNQILFLSSKGHYVTIGDDIYSFRTVNGDEILDLESHYSDYKCPYGIGRTHTYFLSIPGDSIIAVSNRILQKMGFYLEGTTDFDWMSMRLPYQFPPVLETFEGGVLVRKIKKTMIHI